MSAMAFAEKVAVITGASSGIGWEIAKALARRRCAVGVLARRQDRLVALTDEIKAGGGRAEWAVADVADRAAAVVAIHSLRDRLGPIDLLVANSGFGMPTTLEPLNVDVVEQMFKVNTLGVIYAIEAVLPDMLQRGSGHLAAVSSLGAYLGIPGESGYCASKAAVNTYMDGLRRPLRTRGIHVTTLCPGFVDTPMVAGANFDMPWLMKAEDAAERMVKALERKCKVYDFPWQLAFLMKLAAWLPDWLLSRIFADKVVQP